MITFRSAAARRSLLRRVSLVVCAGLLAAAPGCSKMTKPKEDERAAEAAKVEPPAVAPKVEKKEAKPAPAPVVVRHVPADFTKWQLADLGAGLSNHDFRFLPAVMMFTMQPGDGTKKAAELKGLLEQAGQMKDDPSIALPLPPAPNAPVTAAKPVVPGGTPAGNAPATTTPPMRRGRRMGGMRGP